LAHAVPTSTDACTLSPTRRSSDLILAHLRQTYRPPENVTIVGPRPREALPAEYGAASVYLQLSRSEGLPNVLCEAMACGCIPVGDRKSTRLNSSHVKSSYPVFCLQ